mgnify:FL=1
MLKEKTTNIWQAMVPYVMTGILTVITLVMMLYTLKIYPFGDRTYLWADGDQYLGIAGFFGSLSGKNDIFYSWGNVLGGNALVELAYYSFSPFNILYIMFQNHLMFAAHAVAYLKIVASALSFCYCLLSIYGEKDRFLKAILSVCYAFMGYMVFYGWNTSWMDGVILLPVMYVGIRKIIEGRNLLQYALALGIAVIANFYIGYMLCIGSVLFYVAQLVLSEGKFWEKVKRSFVKYAFASLAGVGTSAFLLVPTYLSLPAERKLTISEMFHEMHLTIKLPEILSGLFTGQVNSLDGNAPLIYVGVFVTVLDILFFVSKKISFRKKAVFFTLILIFCISFENSFINQIWHGMSENVCFNYRYSFMLSFLLLLIACETCEMLQNGTVTRKELFLEILILGAIFAIVVVRASDKINLFGILLDAISVLLIFALFFMRKSGKQVLSILLLCCSVVTSLVCNGYFYLKDMEMYSNKTYESTKLIMQNATEAIKDESFYRMDKSFISGRCDGNLFDYAGVTNYASTEKLENLSFLSEIGVRHTWMWAAYTPNLPVATEALLGLKYVLTDTENGKGYERVGGYEDISYLKNPYALPVLFPVDRIENYDLYEIRNFTLLNKMWRSINGLEEDVFQPCTVSGSSLDGKKNLEVTVEKAGSVYLFIPSGFYTTIQVRGAGIERNIDYDYTSEIYYIGEFVKGDQIHISMEETMQSDDLDAIVCYTENRSAISENARLVEEQNVLTEEESSSHLIMTYSGKKHYIATTIPYDEAWKVYDNGKEVSIEKNWSNFLAFQLEDTGEHKIELIYRPIGFEKGCKLSCISIVLLILFEILNSNVLRRHMEKQKSMQQPSAQK